MIKELNNVQAPQVESCENCGKKTICFLVGHITPISRELSWEEWICTSCVGDIL
jgi:hypothetical protein